MPRNRIIPLPSGWVLPDVPEDDASLLIADPSPLDEMRELAGAVARGDGDSADAIMRRARGRIERAVLHELQRLVGQMVVEVAGAETVRDKVGHALALGAGFMEARPPDHLLAQCEHPERVVAAFEAACEGLLTFLAGELAASVADARGTVPRDCRLFVKDAIAMLRDGQVEGESDELDRKSRLAVWLVAQLRVPQAHGFRSP